jgi:hypothetical protein
VDWTGLNCFDTRSDEGFCEHGDESLASTKARNLIS